jgi:hypothetical protein
LADPGPGPLGAPDYPVLSDERHYGTVTLGDAGSDSYLAGTDANIINAAAGYDRLYGGVGDDYLIGGYGSDTYLIGINLVLVENWQAIAYWPLLQRDCCINSELRIDLKGAFGTLMPTFFVMLVQ